MLLCYRPIIPSVYDDTYTYYEQMCALANALRETLDYVDSVIKNYEDNTDSKIEKAISDCKLYTDDSVNKLYKLIERELDNVKLSGCYMTDPWTGQVVKISDVVNKIIATTNVGAFTASEYDALELTASAYDAKELTAYQYDWLGKTLLP